MADRPAVGQNTGLGRVLCMGHQPEYCQPHSHEQTEPAPSFGREKAEQIAFHQSACRNLLNPVRLISHVITTSLVL